MTRPIRQNSAASREGRGHDLYETHPVAVHALVKVENLPARVWEPAAGRGAIVNVLRSYGHTVLATDLVDYGIPGHHAGLDFLHATFPVGTPDCIVTNPPYFIGTEFAERAVMLAPKVCLLMRLSFIASMKRSHLLERSGLARIHVFRNRLPMMHRDGWTGPRAGSNVDHAWFVWDRSHIGPAVFNRISWEPIDEANPGFSRILRDGTRRNNWETRPCSEGV